MKLSIRLKTAILFIGLVSLIVVTLALIFFGALTVSFNKIEENTAKGNVQRIVTLLQSDTDALWTSGYDYSFWTATVDAILARNETVWNSYIEGNFVYRGQYRTILGWNLLSFYNASYNPVWSVHYPPAQDGSPVGLNKSDFPQELLDKATMQKLGTSWRGVLSFPGMQPLLAAVTPVREEETEEVFGTMLVAKYLSTVVSTYPDIARVCVTMWPRKDASADAKDATEAFESLAGMAREDYSDWGNVTHVGVVDQERQLRGTRYCPNDRSGSGANTASKTSVEVGFALLKDPYSAHPEGPLLRVDHLRESVSLGKAVFWVLLAVIIVSFGVFAGAFLFFLDRSVLRRIAKLSFLIDSVESPRHRSDTSASSASSVSLSSVSDVTKTRSGSDEVKHLENTLLRKLDVLRAELAAEKNAVQALREKSARTRGALRLLNLWCGRAAKDDDGVPGAPASTLSPVPLSPTAGGGAVVGSTPVMSPTMSPTPGSPTPSSPAIGGGGAVTPSSDAMVSVEEILDDPIAVEFVKVHCQQESTSENIMFLIDMRCRRKQLRDSPQLQARWDDYLRKEYFSSDSPHPLNIGSDLLRRAATDAAAFDIAEREVQHLMDSDVLPRFKGTRAFHAMKRAQAHAAGTVVEPAAAEISKATMASILSNRTQHKRLSSTLRQSSGLSEDEVREAAKEAKEREKEKDKDKKQS